MNYLVAACYLIPGLIIIIVTDILGAIASRKYHFNYSYLSVVSIAMYIIIGFLASRQAGLVTAVLVNCLLGLFDSTVGLYISIKLKANTVLSPERLARLLNPNTALIMILFAFLLTIAGHLLTFL
ncbi:hypothetical protein [Chitinophaga sp. RAB17]|uniref:hypothetical protein n=1 Tax=Chitinophaga sp. RAB17 TaxID=3233049 RepID=UPI003F923187